MSVKWDAVAQAAACGLAGLALVFLVRVYRSRQPGGKPSGMSLVSAIVTVLGFSVAPAIPVFVMYPFIFPKPDLKDDSIYLLVAGIALGYFIYETYKQGIS